MTPSPIFRVENLGPIRSGEVELRPLTLLIGKNNTGKTYMAQAIHAAHKALDKAFDVKADPVLEPSELGGLLPAARNQHNRSDEESEGDTGLNLPAAIFKRTQTWIQDLFQCASDELPGRLLAYFSVPHLDDISSWNTENSCSVAVLDGTTAQPVYLFGTGEAGPTVPADRVALSESTLDRIASFVNHHSRTDDDNLLSAVRGARDHDNRLHTPWSLSFGVWYNHLRSLEFGYDSYYLPSGRSGLLQAWTDVVRMKLQLDRERFGLARDRDIALGGVALDFLSEFQGLFSPQRIRPLREPSEEQNLAAAIQLLEQAIRGSVAITAQPGEVPALIYEQYGHRIPIQRASSMTADIAPLAVWVKQLVDPADLLIVDEPESHLHPEAIRLVARALVRLANAGVKVLCATHSSVLLHQVSNCMLSARDPGGNGDLAVDDAISHSDIGVFCFKDVEDERGAVIERVTIDPDWGIPEDEYVEIADALTNQTAALIDSRTT